MHRSKLTALAVLGSAAALAFSTYAPAAPGGGPATFEVTITNLTPGQIFSPVLLATHDSTATVFRGGETASAELALLAEEGDNSTLFAALSAASAVLDVQSGTANIAPGGSETIMIQGAPDARLLSMASMLVTTNDTFAGLDSVPLPAGRSATLFAYGWDAGSEANSENCMYVPGPPCGSGGSHDPSPAEGFIAISNGVHGQGSLVPSEHDWRGPVARIAIRRL
ncbi:MAG: spondin domain-containing protein [Planctomycetota bacterium]